MKIFEISDLDILGGKFLHMVFERARGRTSRFGEGIFVRLELGSIPSLVKNLRKRFQCVRKLEVVSFNVVQ